MLTKTGAFRRSRAQIGALSAPNRVLAHATCQSVSLADSVVRSYKLQAIVVGITIRRIEGTKRVRAKVVDSQFVASNRF